MCILRYVNTACMQSDDLAKCTGANEHQHCSVVASRQFRNGYESKALFNPCVTFLFFLSPLCLCLLASDGNKTGEQTAQNSNTPPMEKTGDVENGNNNNCLSQPDLTSTPGKSITCKHETIGLRYQAALCSLFVLGPSVPFL